MNQPAQTLENFQHANMEFLENIGYAIEKKNEEPEPPENLGALEAFIPQISGKMVQFGLLDPENKTEFENEVREAATSTGLNRFFNSKIGGIFLSLFIQVIYGFISREREGDNIYNDIINFIRKWGSKLKDGNAAEI